MTVHLCVVRVNSIFVVIGRFASEKDVQVVAIEENNDTVQLSEYKS